MDITQTELLVQHSRRQLWTALVLVLALGTAMLFQLAFPASLSNAGKTLMILYPDMVAIGLVSLHRSKRRLAGLDPGKAQVFQDDELRQRSLSLAWRNAFFVMLLAQPLLGLAVNWSGTPYPVALLAGASALAGVVTALASVLYYDR